MADDSKRYINNIYINGIPYACRDEELTKSVADLTLKTERIGHILSNHDTWLNNCYDSKNGCLKGNVNWNELGTTKLDGQKEDGNLAPFPVFSAKQIIEGKEDYIVRISTKANFSEKKGWVDPINNDFTPIGKQG